MTVSGRVPPTLHTAAQCRDLDRRAIDTGIPGFELMRRAGEAAFRELLARWPDASRLAVCCGKGNNAGDGYLVAGLARRLGMQVRLFQIGDPAELKGDAARARDWAGRTGVVAEPGPPSALAGDVVVDALLGTGIQGELREPYARSAELINDSRLPVLAVDVPTGVNADNGHAVAHAVRADLTVTFIARKLGLHTGPGVSHAGTVVFDDLGVPPEVRAAVPGLPWYHYPQLPGRFRLSRRDANAHKHALGHLVVVGGDRSMGGAPLMAAEAALRCGAGMVSLLTRAEHRAAVLARRPEVMVVDADRADQRQDLLDRATALVVGPGLGSAPWGEELLSESLGRGLPTVVDADGLNAIARLGLRGAGPLVITPHAGEAARLLECTSAAVQADRPARARALAGRLNAVTVLKGPGTILAAPGVGGDGELLGVCAHGNPGMASAGMGDVLSGIVGALLAQGLDPAAAAVTGACLHSFAGDRAVTRFGPRSLLATDLTEAMVDILADEARGGPGGGPV